MIDTLVAEKPRTLDRDPPFIRRFERPDIDKHAAWFIPRLLKSYPHLTERSVYTWLLGILDSNDFMFLYLDRGVALAQSVQYGLRSEAVIEEQFVWVEDPTNKEMQADAAFVYQHFYEWAKRKGLSTVIVEENSNVSHDLVGLALGKRLFERKQVFTRVA